MSKSKNSSKRRKNRILRQLIFLFFLAIFLGGGYYYITYHVDDSHSESASIDNSEYVLLENNDSIQNMIIVMYNKNVSINSIANTFYKSDIFWPYIYIQNKQVLYNPLNIEAETVLRIPILSDTLLDVNNTASVQKVKLLADSILNSVNEPI